MNWEAVGAVGEIVGAIAVVITLIYLARQMRQNSSALRSTTAQSANEMAFSVYNPIVANEYGRARYTLAGTARPGTAIGLGDGKVYCALAGPFFTWQN